VSPTSASVEQGSWTTATVTVTSLNNYNLTVSITASGQPSGVAITFSPSSGTPLPDMPFSSTMVIIVGSNAPKGVYKITITGTGADSKVWTTTYTLTVTEKEIPPVPDTTPPPTPSLISPPDGTVTEDNTPTFDWSDVTDLSGVTYTLEIIDTLTKTGLTSSIYTLTSEEALAAGTYLWRVRAVDGAGNPSGWPETWSLIVTIPPPPGIPTSSVDTITPYWQKDVPFTVTAQASDNDGYVESVELWYRYSTDNSSWVNWKLFGMDGDEPWSWPFTALEGDGYYEFYSIARDNDNNVEPAPLQADARCGVDRAAPSAPRLVSPVDDATIATLIPTFNWDDVSDLSGVSYYELVIDNDSDFSSPVLSKVGLMTSEYSLIPVENLAEDEYYWRVRAVDGATNVGAWSDAWFLVIRLAPIPTVEVVFIPGGENRVADFENENIPVLEVTITTVENDEENVVVTVEIREDIKVSAPPGIVHAYMKITLTNITHANVKGLLTRFRVSRSWVVLNDIDEDTIRMFKFLDGQWQELPTEQVGADADNLYFEASVEGFSLFAVTGRPKEVIPPPPPIMPVFYALLTVFGTLGGGAVAYLRWFRPIAPSISLKRLIVSRPPVSVERLRRIVKPAISLERLTPAPMTLAPAIPAAPLEPVPIVTRPPAPPLRRVVPKVMPPPEILEGLKRVAPRVKLGVPLERLKRVARPAEPVVPLERLKRVARPAEPVVSLERLARVGRPMEPVIPVKRLERVARPLEPGIPLKRLKEVAKRRKKKREQ